MLRLGYSSFLESDEKIKKVFRTPFYFAFPGIFTRALLWGIITYILWFFYPMYHVQNLNWLWQLTAILGFLHVFWRFFYWYVNGILLTTESVVLVDWPRFFERRSTRIDFHNLDEITVEKVGMKSFFLNYGNLFFAKTNGGDAFVVKNISGPNKAARVIESYREWILDQKNFSEESALKGLLSNLVQRHHGGETETDTKSWFHSVTHKEMGEKKETREETEERVRYVERPVERRLEDEAIVVRDYKPKKRVTQLEDEFNVEKQFDDEGGVGFKL